MRKNINSVIDIMEQKKYEVPAILEDVNLEVACSILAQSVVSKNKEVESVGQEVVDHTMTTGYEHSWE